VACVGEERVAKSGEQKDFVGGGTMPCRMMLRELNEVHEAFLDLQRGIGDAVADAAHALGDSHPSWHGPAPDDGAHADRAAQITERCQRLLVLYQPVAADFRRVTAILQMVGEWEHVSALAKGIADRAAELAPWLVVVPHELADLAAVVAGLVRDAGAAYEDGGPGVARGVVRMTAALGARASGLTGCLVEAMRADPAAVEPGLGLFAVVQDLLRIAGHAARVAEEVIVLTDGWDRCRADRAAGAPRAARAHDPAGVT